MFPVDYYIKDVIFSSSSEESRVSFWLIKNNFLCALPSSSFVLKYNKLFQLLGLTLSLVIISAQTLEELDRTHMYDEWSVKQP